METIPKIPQTLVCGIFLSAFTAPFQKAMPAHQNFAPFNFARSAESKCAGQRKRNETENAFAAIDVMLKKRYDLIPNLVTTVKEYAENEKSTFAQITEMRNKSYASFSNQDKENLDSAFSQACTHFFAIAENYPQLKASENFEQLQRALNETEEQLSAARRTFNACVTDYNNAVQTFPSNLLAGMFGFTRKSVFSISEQERTAPNVNNLLNQSKTIYNMAESLQFEILVQSLSSTLQSL